MVRRNQDGIDVVTDSFTFVRNTSCPNQAGFPTDKVFDPIIEKASKLHDTENIFSNFWDKVTSGK